MKEKGEKSILNSRNVCVAIQEGLGFGVFFMDFPFELFKNSCIFNISWFWAWFTKALLTLKRCDIMHKQMCTLINWQRTLRIVSNMKCAFTSSASVTIRRSCPRVQKCLETEIGCKSHRDSAQCDLQRLEIIAVTVFAPWVSTFKQRELIGTAACKVGCCCCYNTLICQIFALRTKSHLCTHP